MKSKLLSLILTLSLLSGFYFQGYAINTDPSKKTTETNGQQVERGNQESMTDQKIQPQPKVENNQKVTPKLKVKQEDEQPSFSSMSFNFIFYVIYKFKYADIFNFSKRHDANNHVGLLDSVNKLYQTMRLLR